MDTAVLRGGGDETVWKTNLDTEKGSARLALEGLGPWQALGGEGDDQPHVGARSDTGTIRDLAGWKMGLKHPHSHPLGCTIPSAFRTEAQRLRRGLESS